MKKYFHKINSRLTGSTHQGERHHQEDRVAVIYNEIAEDKPDEMQYEYLFVGIFDGHGGAEAANYAKEHLEYNITEKRGFWSHKNEDILKAIREGFLQTHNAMWKEQDTWPKTHGGFKSTSGTTASTAFIKNGCLYVGHAGDSKIVLAEAKEDGQWKAVELTKDHKPEDEKQRIGLAGGKVITKAGVPRVVWHRPQTANDSRCLRSTKTDEIPFLAIARSLGDLWSYNSSTGQFVVSPEPDLNELELNLAKHKCLIFGTDGLWNVISPQSAVDIVLNCIDDNLNPSTTLVDEALSRWRANDKRADNISCVTVLLDVDDEEELTDEHDENLGFFGEEDEEMYAQESITCESAAFDTSTAYQDISHMAVTECEVLNKVKRNPACNAIYPKCVMRHSTTFERYDYMRHSS